jgi:hypothetical protein
MPVAIFQKGRRLFSTAAILMIVTAILHTIGNYSVGDEPAGIQSLVATMTGFHFPMGMGMNPSMWDVYRALVFLMTITFLALGIINLLIAASPDVPATVLRRLSWFNLIWVGAYGILVWYYQIPPPLIFAVLIELAIAGSLVTLPRSPHL